MLEQIKQVIIRLTLVNIRALIRLKPYATGAIRILLKPFLLSWHFFIDFIIVPLYRLTYGIRKQLNKVYGPARNKIMLFITNRYVVHVIMISITILATVMNLHVSDVRAENFGSESLMYKLASNQDVLLIEDTKNDSVVFSQTRMAYQPVTTLTATVKDDVLTEISNIQLVGSGTISTPTITDGSDSIAPRTEIEKYVVESGDTISVIAEKFGISTSTILWENDLTVRSVLKPGDELTILPVTGIKHTVESGDTLLAIADEYSGEEVKIIEFNRLADSEDIVIGEELIIPDGEKKAPEPVKVVSAPAVVSQPVTNTNPTIVNTPQNTITTQPSPGTGSMVWPSDLRVITHCLY